MLSNFSRIRSNNSKIGIFKNFANFGHFGSSRVKQGITYYQLLLEEVISNKI